MDSFENRDAVDRTDLAVGPGQRATGKRRGRRPRLGDREQAEIVRMYRDPALSTAEIRARFGISDSSLYRLLQRHGVSLRGRSQSATRSQPPVSTSGSKPRRTRRAGRVGRPRATGATARSGRPRRDSRPNNGLLPAFRVSFTAVQVIVADTPLEAVRATERLGATDILTISRQ